MNENELTVGKLKAALEGIPDETPVATTYRGATQSRRLGIVDQARLVYTRKKDDMSWFQNTYSTYEEVETGKDPKNHRHEFLSHFSVPIFLVGDDR